MDEPNQDDDSSTTNSSSSFQRAVILRDWWLIKCSIESEGKRFGVAGIEDSSDSFHNRKRALRVFTSSPIIKAFDVFTLQASDGTCITLQGFLNRERVVKCGFDPEILREFVFGFPPCWEKCCNDCFKGDVFSGCNPFLSPCENKKGDFEGIEKSIVTENDDEDGCGGFRGGDERTVRRKSLRVQLIYGGKCVEGEREVELSKVQDATKDGDLGSRGFEQAKSSDVGDEFEAVDNEVVLPEDGCGRMHASADNVDNGTSMNGVGELLTSEQQKEELKVTRAALRSDTHKSRKPGKKEEAKKSERTLKSDKAKSVDVEKDECEGIVDEVIAPASVQKLTSENLSRESEQRKGKPKTQTLVKGSDSKTGKRPKESEKTLKSDQKVVEPMNHTGSRGKEGRETLSWEKTRRKIDFDVESKVSPEKKAKRQKSVINIEVTPAKEVTKQETIADSAGSLGQRRSRSGRVLMSPLEFWRNEVPVYDKDRNIIQVKEGHESPFQGKGSSSQKPRR